MDLKEMFTRKASGPAPASDDPVQAARRRARQRLVGAALLLVVGIVAFPLLFETKPRPLPLDTPIVSARAPAGAPNAGATLPAPKPVLRAVPTASPAPAPEPAASAPTEAPAPVDAPPPAEPAAPGGTRAAAAPPVKAASAPVPAPAAAVAAEAPGAASAPRAARYVVQVGAFSEAATAREVRTKVERLGLKTYTQVVDTDNGKRTRVRIGPFASREEAMQTLARIQAANLPGVVLAL